MITETDDWEEYSTTTLTIVYEADLYDEDFCVSIRRCEDYDYHAETEVRTIANFKIVIYLWFILKMTKAPDTLTKVEPYVICLRNTIYRRAPPV